MVDDPAAAEDWTTQLLGQLTFHWDSWLRPRFDGLTDDEHRWEPVPGCWSIRPREDSTAPLPLGEGPLVLDFDWPPPEVAPVTTIAWRLAHLTVGVFGVRSATHFGGVPVSNVTKVWPATAADALAELDDAYAVWCSGVRALDDDALAAACGPAEGAFAEYPMKALVLHIHREAIHHGAEIALLRDLYLHRPA